VYRELFICGSFMWFNEISASCALQHNIQITINTKQQQLEVSKLGDDECIKGCKNCLNTCFGL